MKGVVNMKVKEIRLDTIRLDGGTQIRESMDQKLVEQYREAIIDGQEFPPVDVFDDGDAIWLADGFHRWHATDSAGLVKIKANIREGTQRDAILFAVGANATHGLARSNADKRKAVLTMLTDEHVNADDNGNPWSDNAIAKKCGVSHPFVGSIRASLETVTSDERSYTTKHGTTATMNTKNIGKTLAKVYVTDDGEELDNVTEIKTTQRTLTTKEADPNEDAEDVGIGTRFSTDSTATTPRKSKIAGADLEELRGLLSKLKQLTDVPSMQLSPLAIRRVVDAMATLVL